MTNLSKERLAELRERVEKASGPDREIDCLLGDLVDLTIDGSKWRSVTALGMDQALKHASRYQSIWFTALPYYTASIDAALALLERMLPGWGSAILSWSADGKYPVFRMERSYPTNLEVAVEAHTRPLAILSALLFALTQDTP